VTNVSDNTRERKLTFNNTRGNRVMLKGRKRKEYFQRRVPKGSVSQRNLFLSKCPKELKRSLLHIVAVRVGEREREENK